MTKILLVEDESIVRKGIALSIDWAEYGAEITDEASNGEEALKKCQSTQPDIVITDIRMPQMDGLEFVKKLREILPDTKVIILSGYEDFNYAKRAIALNVSDYLLKPVNEEELVSAVKKLQKQIENEQERSQAWENTEYLIKQNIMTIQSKFLRQIFEGKLKNREDILEEARKRNVDLGGKRYGVFLLHIDQKSMWKSERWEMNQEMYRFVLCNIAEEVIEEKVGKGILVFYENMDFAGVLCMKYLERFSMMDLLKDIQNKIRKDLGTRVSVGVGNIYPDLEDLRLSFQEARKALKNKFYFGSSSLNFFSEAEEADKGEFLYPIKEEQQAMTCQRNMDQEGVIRIQDQIFKKFKSARPEESKVRDACYRFVNMLVKNAGEQGANISKCLGTSFNAYADIQAIETLDEIQDWIMEIARRLHREMMQNEKYSVIVMNAMEYMEKHYSREISLTELAGKVGVTPNYFSRIFKEETGINFVDWLNKLRIEKAVQLLDDGTMKIYEVAEKVGFSNYKYFSAIFKKVLGCTPKQYQKR